MEAIKLFLQSPYTPNSERLRQVYQNLVDKEATISGLADYVQRSTNPNAVQRHFDFVLAETRTFASGLSEAFQLLGQALSNQAVARSKEKADAEAEYQAKAQVLQDAFHQECESIRREKDAAVATSE